MKITSLEIGYLEEHEERQHFLNLYYVVLGLLTGIFGNLWAYYFSKFLETQFSFPKEYWAYIFYVSTVLLALWLFFFIRYIVRGMKKGERKEGETVKEEKKEKKVKQ
jgi:H+/Cl- antiporter ClcA